jgi:hypothetical protein
MQSVTATRNERINSEV